MDPTFFLWFVCLVQVHVATSVIIYARTSARAMVLKKNQTLLKSGTNMFISFSFKFFPLLVPYCFPSQYAVWISNPTILASHRTIYSVPFPAQVPSNKSSQNLYFPMRLFSVMILRGFLFTVCLEVFHCVLCIVCVLIWTAANE